MKKVLIYLAIVAIFSIGSILSFPLGIPFWKGLIISVVSALMTNAIILLFDYAVNGKR